MNKVTKRFGYIMLASLVVALIDIFAGIVFIKCSNFETKVNLMILGNLIIIHSLLFFIRYFYDGLGNKFFAIDLIVGVASLILGIFTILNPLEKIEVYGKLKIIGPIFCVWLCINGIEKLYYSYRFMRAKESIYPLTGFIGILMILMGILSLANPFKYFVLITRLIGIFLICSGLFDGMICNLFRQRASHILEIFE